jgi:thiamine biosynthesis lipoprotein
MPYPLPRTASRTAGVWALGATMLVFGLVLAGCRGETPVTTTRFNAFGSQVDLSLVGVNPVQAERAAAAIKQDFEFMHRAWHAWEPGPMGRVNQLLPKGEPFVAPPSVMPLVRLSQRYSEQSGGLFNPAIGHLIDLWGFHADTTECEPPPSRRSIERLVKANPQMSDVRIQGLELQGANSALKLDFGAIAKGYAIDLAIEALRALGVRHALVQIGGDLRAIGDRSGQPWRVAIRRPSGSGVLAILKTQGDESVTNAAAYDRNFVYGGTTYHHILDPRTGWPAQDTLAVTVAHGDATAADAAATALFVAGPERWHAVAQAMGIRYVLLVDSKGTLHMSPEMQARLELMDPSAEVRISPPLSSPDAGKDVGSDAGSDAGSGLGPGVSSGSRGGR